VDAVQAHPRSVRVHAPIPVVVAGIDGKAVSLAGVEPLNHLARRPLLRLVMADGWSKTTAVTLPASSAV
jgi:hypothetical protein